MAKDWTDMLKEIENQCDSASGLTEGFSFIYQGIEGFCKKYNSVFEANRTEKDIFQRLASSFDKSDKEDYR